MLAGAVKARGEAAARALGLDEDRAAARHLGHHLGDAPSSTAASVFNLLDTPGHQDFSRGHLPHADRGRFGGDGDRRRQGHRGADAQAVRGLPAARRADHHLHQQGRPRGPDPLELLDEIASTAGARCQRRMTWPIGMGQALQGHLRPRAQPHAGVRVRAGPQPHRRGDRASVRHRRCPRSCAEEVELVRRPAIRRSTSSPTAPAHLTPVFFGSALNNFGVARAARRARRAGRRRRARSRPSRGRSSRPSHEVTGLRVQGPGQHGPATIATASPSCGCARARSGAA